jgi:hypothetical protein
MEAHLIFQFRSFALKANGHITQSPRHGEIEGCA